MACLSLKMSRPLLVQLVFCRIRHTLGGLMIAEQDLLEITKQQLNGGLEPVSLEPIVKGGSDRRFFRLGFSDDAAPSLILMTYTLARPDNPRFVSATRRLQSLGVHVPRVYAHDTNKLCVWLEDLGSVDLYAYKDAPWTEREPLYREALKEGAKLHRVKVGELAADDLADMEPAFDEALYLWEQDYFTTHYMRGMRGRQDVPEEVSAVLQKLRQTLAALPRCLVHRDFQSQNVIVRDDEAWLIDYQGVRPGLAGYDLASLLLDPYVSFQETERQALLDWYASHEGRDRDTLMSEYHLCAAQRLMQALGAYANLSRNQGKPHFEQHAPVALERLLAVTSQHPLLQPLARWIA